MNYTPTKKDAFDQEKEYDPYDSILDQFSISLLIKDYVSRKNEYDKLLAKHEYLTRISNSVGSSSKEINLNFDLPPKPKLEDFIKAFDLKIKEINETYKDAKIQF